ncbi:beta strand repeat-containing protein [Planctomicrobium sp. SH664]|uniref:beta strand repeat-containing protein n=1 Tax=Planctomicrobium sp. SH664 TaxID=3448125 RepID=UPI003F5BA01B
MAFSRTMEIIRRMGSKWSVTGAGRLKAARRWLMGAAAGAAIAGVSLPALGQMPMSPAPQGPPPGMDFTMPYPGQDQSGAARFSDDSTDIGVGGFGIKGRIGHEAGKTVGREQSITFFDLSPYMFLDDNSILFTEGRLALGNNGRLGGTAGGGVRHYFERINSIAGVSAFYDGDDTRDVMFKQWGVSTELLTEWIDWRTNLYFPFGDQQKEIANVFAPGSTQFAGQNLIFQRRITTATVMQGIDMMFTAPIPGEIPEKFNLEIGAGWYHFQADDDSLPEATGWKLRGDADVFDRLSHMFLEVMHDSVFKTNVVFGIDVNYWHHLEARPRIGRTQYNRLAEWVRRNRTTVALEQATLSAPEIAINPDTGLPYVVAQVRNVLTPPPANFPFPIGNGTIATPYQFIREGLSSGADIVFVQGNSVFDGTLIGDANAQADLSLGAPGVMVVGEGTDITIPVQGVNGGITLPTVTTAPFDTPVIRNLNGPAVILADGSDFAGFDIENVSNGPAILANGVIGSNVSNVTIDTVTGVGANGIELTNNSGLLNFTNITVNGAEDATLFVQGGNANILFGGTNVFNNSTGYAVFVEDAGGSVNLSSTLITSTGGNGITIQGTAPGTSTAAVTFEQVTLTDTNAGAPAAAVLIDNHFGTVAFTGNLSIDNNEGDAFVVQNLGQSGTVSVSGNTTINDRQGRGIYINNIQEGANPANPSQTIAGSVIFSGTTTINDVAAGFVGLDPAVQMQSDSGTLSFLNTLTIDGSNGSGIEISNINNTGTVNGQFLSNSLIQIENTAGTAFNVENVAKSNFFISTSTIDIDDRLGMGINIDNFAGTAQFLVNTQVDNGLASTASAVNVTNNTGSVTFQSLTVEDAVGTGPGSYAVRVFNNFNPDATLQSIVSFGSLNVESANATAVSFENNERISVGNGVLDTTTGRAIEVLNNGQHSITLTEVNATAADYGILVLDSFGTFTVNGSNNTPGSGGTITGMTVAGAAFENTQAVRLQYMDLTANFRGVTAQDMLIDEFNITPQLILQGMNIDGSLAQGIRTVDVLNFQLLDSIVNNNGRGGGLGQQQQIWLTAATDRIDSDNDGDVDDNDDLLTYSVLIDGNTISDNVGAAIVADDMILIDTLSTIADPVTLSLVFTNNGTPPSGVDSITSNRNGASALNVNWEGNVGATISRNVFNLLNGNGTITGSNQTGVEMNIDGSGDIVYTFNTMTATGATNTGLMMNFRRASAVQISDNVVLNAAGNNIQGSGFLFSGADSTAVDLTFQSSSNRVFFERNLVQFTGNGFNGTGMLVQRVFGDSDFFINNNLIELVTDLDTIPERGIYFQDVRGVIDLFGSVNNSITPGTFLPFVIDFFAPTGTTNGSIIVNGSQVP